jgi:hypothetical protein
MRYIACKSLNWGNNGYPVGEEGYCVIFMNDGSVSSIRWFSQEMFEELFKGELNGEF